MKGHLPRVAAIATAIALALGMTGSPLSATPVRADTSLSISGKVVGSAGNLGGIAISGCTTDWMFCTDTVLTDDAGNFSLGVPVGGFYVLLFETGPTYLYGYYQGPGLADSSLATPIDTTGGSVVLPDVQLTTAYWISGVVTGSAGSFSGLQVSACPIDYSGCANGTMDASGSYSVGGLAPKTYQLWFSNGDVITGYNKSPYVWGQYTGDGLTNGAAGAAAPAQIVITDSNVVLPTFEIPVGATITGRLAGDVGQLGDISVSASEDDFGGYSETHPDANGNFTLQGLWPGSYRIVIWDWSNTYISGTYTPDGLVQSDEPHQTVGPDGLALGTIQLYQAATISGTLTGSVGHYTSVLPMACRSDGFCAQGSTDAGGHFSVSGLVPGDYTLRFDDWSQVYQSGYYSDTGVEVADSAEATLISVPPSVSGLRLILNRGLGQTVPGAPTNVVAIPGDSSADVTWTPPLDDGGAHVYQYVVTASDGTTCYSSTTECLVNGLTNGQTYTFTVVAENWQGDSDPSAPSDPVTVNAPPPAPVATQLVVTANPATVAAGAPETITVKVLDEYGNVFPGYEGQVCLSSSDPFAMLGGCYAFTPADAGVHQFTISLGLVGPQLVTAADNDVLQPGQTTVTVTPGPVANIFVAGPDSATAGVAQTYVVTAVDAWGNVATNLSGKVKLHKPDRSVSAPAYVNLVNGVGTFKATFTKAGTEILGVGDPVNGPYGEIYVQVNPAAAARLVISGALRRSTVGAPVTITVTAVDRFGNVATGYTGTVHFTSNDRAAALPGAYTFTAQDAGVHTFTITLNTVGARWVKVRDTGKHPLGAIVRIQVVKIPKGRL